MSEFHVNVVRVGDVIRHPNADALSIARVFDYAVIVRTGEFQTGDLAVYLPVDSVLPDTPQWRFLAPKDHEYPDGVPEKYRRLKAKKLRGIFSQGLLAPLPSLELQEGDDCTELMGVTKWDPPPVYLKTTGESEEAPRHFDFVRYTDLEGLKRYPSVLLDGEPVVITEKVHGCCARYVHDGARLWAGSRTQIRKQMPGVVWWDVAQEMQLEDRMRRKPGVIFFGEVYGRVQDLDYGISSGALFLCFDSYDLQARRYNDWDVTAGLCDELELPRAPVLYRGPWSPDLRSLAEGKSTMAAHVREGFVVKPLTERYDPRIGRVILKMVGEGYLLRKSA